MNLDLNINIFLKSNNYKKAKDLSTGINLEFIIEEEGKKFFVKTNRSLDTLEKIENELDWYLLHRFKTELPFVKAKLLKHQRVNETLFLVFEFIEEETFEDLNKRNELNSKKIKQLADFATFIENIEYIPTSKSKKTKEIDIQEWNKKFRKNAKEWHAKIIEVSKSKELKDIVDYLESNALAFDINEVGFGGHHGSPKLREYVDYRNKLLIFDWDQASSIYIKYYTTASFISYIFLRIRNSDFTKSFYNSRKYQLSDLEKDKFQLHFKTIISQRMLGDIYDLFYVENIEGVDKKIKWIVNNFNVVKSFF